MTSRYFPAGNSKHVELSSWQRRRWTICECSGRRARVNLSCSLRGSSLLTRKYEMPGVRPKEESMTKTLLVGLILLLTPMPDTAQSSFDGTWKTDIDKNTLEETDKRDGKAHTIIRMMTSADGSTMEVAVHDLTSDGTSKFTMVKQ
jgi:hypothetical protein